MINMRFHIVSLVAVFLALGVGVAMGSSFIDRATVDQMQSRVNDLESRFKDRGGRLDAYQDQTATQDSVAAVLTEPGSRATAGALEAEPVVMIVPDGLPENTTKLLSEALKSGGASVAGTLVLKSPLEATGSSGRSDGASDDLAASLGLDPGDPAKVSAAVIRSLSSALAVLSAEPPGASSTTTSTVPTIPSRTTSTTSTSTTGATSSTTVVAEPLAPARDPAQARALLERLVSAGVLQIDTGGASQDAAFPAIAGVRYLMVVATDTVPSSVHTLVPLAIDYGTRSSATMVVASVRDVRSPGELQDPPGDPQAWADLLKDLREGPASDEVSTVDDAGEPLQRLSVVYTLAAQADGIVGHYGIGDGATAAFPPTGEG